MAEAAAGRPAASSRRAGTAGTRGSAWRRQRLAEIGPVAARRGRLHLRRRPRRQLPARARPAAAGRCTTSGATPSSACLWAVGQGLPDDVVARSPSSARPASTSTPGRCCRWDGGPRPRCTPASPAPSGQWLVDHRASAARSSCAGAPYTAWKDDDTELWVSDGTGTERVAVPATDAYRVMVEEVSSALRGGPGWVLPLDESRETAAVLDAVRPARPPAATRCDRSRRPELRRAGRAAT